MKVALQLFDPLMVTVLSRQSGSPDHPENAEPALGVGISFTTVFWPNSAEQAMPQSMFAGLVVTFPEPFPARVILSPKEIGLKDALQLRLPVIVTIPSEQSASPLQPVNCEPEAAMACRVTELPDVKFAEHLLPQSMPAGLEMTLPLPVPAAVIVPTALTDSR